MNKMQLNKIPVIAIIGPTAVGKTKFSLELARKLNAEVISVNSRQSTDTLMLAQIRFHSK